MATSLDEFAGQSVEFVGAWLEKVGLHKLVQTFEGIKAEHIHIYKCLSNTF